MFKIFNGTAHTINIYNLVDTYSTQDGRKLVLKEENVVPVLVIAAGINLNAVKGNLLLPNQFVNSGIPLRGGVTFTDYDPLPEGYDIIVVSNLYRSAVKELGGDCSKLATVDGVVYMSESDMRPCGCLGLAVG